MNSAKKPSFHLLDARGDVDLGELVTLFESLTGRKPTPAEIDAARKALEEHDAPDSEQG